MLDGRNSQLISLLAQTLLLVSVGLGASIYLTIGSPRAAFAQTLPPTLPLPPAVTSIAITVSDIRAVTTGSTSTKGFTTLLAGPVSFDLMTIGGVEEILASGPLEAGQYHAIRMKVESVVVTRDSVETAADVPSGTIRLAGIIDVEEGKATDAVLRFDSSHSLVFGPDGAIIFKPVVQLEVRPPGIGQSLTQSQVLFGSFLAGTPVEWVRDLPSALQGDGTLSMAVTDISAATAASAVPSSGVWGLVVFSGVIAAFFVLYSRRLGLKAHL